MEGRGTEQQEKLIEPRKARIILVAGILAYLIIGIVIGYTFVWDKYNTGSRYEQEINDALKRVREKPNDVSRRVELGFIYTKALKYNEAREEFEAALRIDPHDITARMNMAYLDIETKKFAEADKILSEVIKEEPGFQAYALLGKSKYLGQKYREAIQSLISARDLNPTDAEVLYLLGLSYEKTGQKKMAADTYKEALRFDPARQDVKEALQKLQAN